MPIIDLPLLQAFRERRQCERCGKRGPVEPHHLTSRGFGGGMRFDVSVNLIALDRLCHQAYHDGRVEKEELIAIIARREKIAPEAVMEEVWRLRREDRK